MKQKAFYFTDNRFKFIAIILLIMFLVFMLLLFLKADEISKSPCSICAEKMGSEITCYSGTMQRIYYQNYSVVDSAIGAG